MDREDIFEDGKPVINGKDGVAIENWADASEATFAALGILEPMICMSYFPVVIKTKHMAELRAFIERRFQMPFYEVFRAVLSNRTYFSQFNIMCTYLYEFNRDDYAWYVHDTTPWWDGRNPKPVPGQIYNGNKFPEHFRRPKPHIADHARYLMKPIIR